MNRIYNTQKLQAGWAHVCARHPQDYAISLVANGQGSFPKTRKRIKDYCLWLNTAMLGKQWRKLKSTQRVTGLVFIETSASATKVQGVIKLPSKAKLSRPFADLSEEAWKAVCKNGSHRTHSGQDKLAWGIHCTKCMLAPSFKDNQIIFLRDIY